MFAVPPGTLWKGKYLTQHTARDCDHQCQTLNKILSSSKVPICTSGEMSCFSNVTIDGSNCYPKCSGLIVTSYTQHDMEDKFRSKLLSYLFKKDLTVYENELKGLQQ